MADDVTLDAGSGGATIRTLEDGSSIHWPVGVVVYATTVGTPDVLQVVTPAAGLPVKQETGASFAVTAASLPLPSGAATAANQSTANTALSAIQVAVEVIDNAISGSEMQVDVVAALPAGDNNIGNVDIVTVPTDPFGANADAASATGSISAKLRFIASTGIPITGTVTVGSHAVTNAGTFVVQEDGASLTALQLIDDAIYADNAAWTDDVSKFALVGGLYQSLPQTITDGRVAPLLLDANGKVVVATHAVTQSGTWNVGTVTTVTTVSTVTNVATIGTSVTPGTNAAHLGKAEDAAHASGDTGVFVLGVRSDTPATTGQTDGDYTAFTFDSSGRLWCNVNNTVTVTGTVAATQSGTWNVGTVTTVTTVSTVTSLSQFAGNAINLGTGAVGTGTLRATLASDDPAVTALQILDNIVSGNEAQVDIVAALPAGTNNIGDVDVASIAAGDNNIGNVDIVTMPNVTLAAGTNTNEVVGDAAHGAAVAGNPILVGLEGRSTAPTAVDDGDVVRVLATLLGKQVNVPYALPANTWSYATATAGVTDTADDEAKAAAIGIRNYVTSVQVINGHATVNTEVVIKDGSTVLWRGWAQAAGGGVSAKFDPPLRGTANTAVNVANITTGSQTYFNLQGFQATE